MNPAPNARRRQDSPDPIPDSFPDAPTPACEGGEPRRISELLAAFRAALPGPRVSLGDLIAALGDRSLGTILLALSLPTVAPVPLGVSVLCDVPLLLFALKLALGRRDHVVPNWLLARSVDRRAAERILDAALPRLAGIERMLTPRYPRLAAIDRERGFGALILLLIVICIVPVPLMGWLPGFALILIALGLLERDGAAIGVGLLFTVAAVVVAILLLGGISYAGYELLSAPA